jgi:hypothetical protein
MQNAVRLATANINNTVIQTNKKLPSSSLCKLLLLSTRGKAIAINAVYSNLAVQEAGPPPEIIY